MKIKIILTCIIINCIYLTTCSSQHWLDSLKISFEFAVQKPEARIFQAKLTEYFLNKEGYNFDYEYGFLIKKNIVNLKKLNIDLGLGYSMFKTTFDRPVDHNYYDGELTKEILILDKYFINSLKIEQLIYYKLIKNKTSCLSVTVPLDLDIAFNKRVLAEAYDHNRTRIEFHKFQTYAGLMYQHKRVEVGLSYRVFNIQEVDKTIFFDFLFERPYPNFYFQKVENYNLNKFKVFLGFQF